MIPLFFIYRKTPSCHINIFFYKNVTGRATAFTLSIVIWGYVRGGVLPKAGYFDRFGGIFHWYEIHPAHKRSPRLATRGPFALLTQDFLFAINLMFSADENHESAKI